MVEKAFPQELHFLYLRVNVSFLTTVVTYTVNLPQYGHLTHSSPFLDISLSLREIMVSGWMEESTT